MATLDPIERSKIRQLLNAGGYVLDFTRATYRQFVMDATGQDFSSKYLVSNGKNLEAIMSEETDRVAGKLLYELLRYMNAFNHVNDQNCSLYDDCVQTAKKLLGVTSDVSTPSQANQIDTKTTIDYNKHMKDLQSLSEWEDTPQKRGYAFEKYLFGLFKEHGLNPRGAFKITGEQIDGSFVLRDEIYLLEAKWTSKTIDLLDLTAFHAKVDSKSGFTRGLFISYSGCPDETLATLQRGRVINFVLMTVRDLAITFERKMPLPEVIWNKVRALAEEGEAYKPVIEM
jgi:hypothetical protein